MTSDRTLVRLPADKEVMLQEYLQARTAATAWFNKAREIRAALMEDVAPSDDHVTDVLSGDTHVEVVPVTQSVIDSKVLRESHPETYKRCLTRTTSYHIREVADDESE